MLLWDIFKLHTSKLVISIYNSSYTHKKGYNVRICYKFFNITRYFHLTTRKVNVILSCDEIKNKNLTHYNKEHVKYSLTRDILLLWWNKNGTCFSNKLVITTSSCSYNNVKRSISQHCITHCNKLIIKL